MNQDVVKGKWAEIKGEIRKMWGNVTGDELEETKGDLQAISGIIQQRYGYKKDDVGMKLDGIVARFKEGARNKTDKLKEDLKDRKN